MTELALTPPELKRLFDVIDLEPMPQSAAVRVALDVWRQERQNALHVTPEQIRLAEHGDLEQYLLVYECAAEPSGDFGLVSAGSSLGPVTGNHTVGSWLSKAGEPVFAQRAQRLFAFALERDEPVCGTFAARFDAAGQLSVEMLAAPLEDPASSKRGIFAAIAFRHPEHGWEDQPLAST